MPFYDVEVEVRSTCITHHVVTVEAESQEAASKAAEHAAPIQWPCDPDLHYERGPTEAIAELPRAEADFIAQSPESRFSKNWGPLHPQGAHARGVGLWTAEAARLARESEMYSGAARSALNLSPMALEPVERYEAGQLPLLKHPGTFWEGAVTLVKQMNSVLLAANDQFALIVRLSTRECIGVATTASDGPANAPDLPEGWAQGKPFSHGHLSHQGVFDFHQLLDAAPDESRNAQSPHQEPVDTE